MKILLAGQKRFGADVLALLQARGDEIAAVSCPITEPPDKLHLAALRYRLPIIPSTLLTSATVLDGVDLILAARRHRHLSRKTRLRAKYGALGYHPSILPRHRGRSAIEWAVRFREPITGGTAYWMSDTVDGGPIAAQDHCHIRPDDDAWSLWSRDLAPMGLRLIARVLEQLDQGIMVAEPQERALATWEPAIDNVPRLWRPESPMLGAADYAVIPDRRSPAAATLPIWPRA